MLGERIELNDHFGVHQRRQLHRQLAILDEVVVADQHGQQVAAAIVIVAPARLDLDAVADAVVEPISAHVHERVAAEVAHHDSALQVAKDLVVGEHRLLRVGYVPVFDLLLPVLPHERLSARGQIQPHGHAKAFVRRDERVGNVANAAGVADVHSVAVVERDSRLGNVDVGGAVQNVHSGHVLVVGDGRTFQVQLALDVLDRYAAPVVVRHSRVYYAEIVPFTWGWRNENALVGKFRTKGILNMLKKR